jgi:hypothetical protein
LSIKISELEEVVIMTIAMWQSFLGWSLVIHWGILILWVVFIKWMPSPIYKLHNYWVPITKQAFSMIHYGGIGLYKLLIIVFNLVPYCALMLIS